MKYYKLCHKSQWIPLSFISFSRSFLSVHCLPLFWFHTRRQRQSLQLPLALSSAPAIKDATNPVDVPICAPPAANSANYTRKSVPAVSLACVPVVPVAARVLPRPAGTAEGTGTAAILDHPDYSNPSHHHEQQPIKTRTFPLQTPWKSLQFPSHHSNCCFILGRETEFSRILRSL